MSKITFNYNLKKDAYNYARIILFRRLFGTSKSLDLMTEKLKENVQNIYEANPISHSQFLEASNHPVYDPIIDFLKIKTKDLPIEKHLNILKEAWPKVEKEYFKILSEVL